MNSIATGFHRQTVANDHGVYEFQSLPVGSYQIPISKSGFEPFVISRVDVLVGQVRTLDAKLPSALRSVISSTPIPASYRMFLFGSGYAGLGLNRRYQQSELVRECHRRCRQRYRERASQHPATGQGAVSITSAAPSQPLTVCHCAICGRQSLWIDPFPLRIVQRRGGRAFRDPPVLSCRRSWCPVLRVQSRAR